MNTSKNSSPKVVQGSIADVSGHTDFTGTIDEAVAVIMDNITKHGKFLYVNGAPYFPSQGPKAQDELFTFLNAAEDPFFTLMPKLQGGQH